MYWSILSTMNRNLLLKIGKNIKRYRQLKGLTQEELAEKLSCHQTYIGKIELGMINASINKLYDITKILDIKLTDLFNFD